MAESPLPDLPPPPPPPPPRPPKASSTPVQDLPPSSSATSNGHPSKNSHSNDTGTGETPVAGVVPVLSTSTSTSGERDPSLLVKAVSPSSTRSPPSTATTTTSNSNNHHTKTKTTTTGSDAIPSSASESHSSSPTPSPPSAPAPAPAVDHHHDNDNEESKVPATASHAIQGGDTSTAQQGEMTPASSSEENRSQAASPRPNSSSRPPPTSIHPPPPTSSSHHPPRPPSHSSHSQPHVPPYDEQQPAALNSNSHLASLLAQAYKDAEALRTEAASSKARAERAERRLSLYESDSFSIQPQPSSQPTTTESQREQLALLTSLETQLAASEAAHADAQGRLQHVVDAWGEYERWLRVVDVRVGDARGAVGTVVGEARAALEGAGVRRAVDAMEVDSVAQPLPPFSRPRLSIHPQQQAYAASTRESMRPPISSGTTVPISMPMTIAGQSLPASNSGQGQGTLYVPATSPFHPGRVRPRTASLEGMGQGGVAKRPRSMASDPPYPASYPASNTARVPLGQAPPPAPPSLLGISSSNLSSVPPSSIPPNSALSSSGEYRPTVQPDGPYRQPDPSYRQDPAYRPSAQEYRYRERAYSAAQPGGVRSRSSSTSEASLDEMLLKSAEGQANAQHQAAHPHSHPPPHAHHPHHAHPQSHGHGHSHAHHGQSHHAQYGHGNPTSPPMRGHPGTESPVAYRSSGRERSERERGERDPRDARAPPPAPQLHDPSYVRYPHHRGDPGSSPEMSTTATAANVHSSTTGMHRAYHHQQEPTQTHVFAPPVTGAPVKRGKYGSSSHDTLPSTSMPAIPGGSSTIATIPAQGSTASVAGVSSAQLIPPGSSQQQLIPTSRFPATNADGQRICRQCGQPGRIKDGKCVEKWGPGPLGPGTVCDRCRKKMKRVERRGTLESQQQAQQQQAQLTAASSSSFSSPGSSNRIPGATYDRSKVQRSDTLLVNNHSHSSLPPPHSPRSHAHHSGHIRERERGDRERDHHHGHHHHSSPPQPPSSHPIPYGAPTQILEREGSSARTSFHLHPHGGSSYNHGHGPRPGESRDRERERERGYDDERERDGAGDAAGSRSRNNSGSSAPSPVHRSNSRSSTAAKQPGDLKLPTPVDYRGDQQRFHRSRQGTPATAPTTTAPIAAIAGGGEDEDEDEDGVEAELDADADTDADPEEEDEITNDTQTMLPPVQTQTGAHGNPYPLVTPRKVMPTSSSLRREQPLSSSQYSSYNHHSAPGSRRRSPNPDYRSGRGSAGNHNGSRKDQRGEEKMGSDDVEDVLLEAVDAAEAMSGGSDGEASPDSKEYERRRERVRGDGSRKDDADDWLREAAGV